MLACRCTPGSSSPCRFEGQTFPGKPTNACLYPFVFAEFAKPGIPLWRTPLRAPAAVIEISQRTRALAVPNVRLTFDPTTVANPELVEQVRNLLTGSNAVHARKDACKVWRPARNHSPCGSRRCAGFCLATIANPDSSAGLAALSQPLAASPAPVVPATRISPRLSMQRRRSRSAQGRLRWRLQHRGVASGHRRDQGHEKREASPIPAAMC